MIKLPFTGRWLTSIAILFPILIFSEFQPAPKKVNNEIILKNEPLTIVPKEFYVADVIDARDNRSAVAWLMPVITTANNQAKPYSVDLHGGALLAIKQFVNHNLPQNKLLRPVVITIRKFSAVETALPAGRAEGHINLNMSFELNNGAYDIKVHLADYNGSAVYNRNAGPPQEIEPTLRHILESGLIYLNTWMNIQADGNIKLAKDVKLVFEDYKEEQEGDTIYYSVNRPLKWDDFQSKILSNKYDAEIFPSFGYEEHNEIIKGVINIGLRLKIYLPKSACWVKDGSRNDYTLNHEQRHFDIAALAAMKFKQKLLNESLPVSNFDGPINVDYLDAYRDMTLLQKQYDKETNHGLNQFEQEVWSDRINKQLNKYNLK